MRYILKLGAFDKGASGPQGIAQNEPTQRVSCTKNVSDSCFTVTSKIGLGLHLETADNASKV